MPNAAPPLNPAVANPALGYLELAWLPEVADGNEGVDLVLALEDNGDGTNKVLLEPKADAVKKGHQIALEGIRVDPSTPPKTKPVEQILVQLQGENQPRPATFENLPCDAVFSTPSAVRKFLIPYYQTQRMLDDAEWKALNDAIADPDVPAIGHVYPSHPGGVGVDKQIRILTTTSGKAKRATVAAAAASADVGETKWMTLREYKTKRNS